MLLLCLCRNFLLPSTYRLRWTLSVVVPMRARRPCLAINATPESAR